MDSDKIVGTADAPDDQQVDTAVNPPAGMQAPADQTQQPSPTTSTAPTAGQPQQQVQQQVQPQQPQQVQPQQLPQAQQPIAHPAVQKASVLHYIAEILAGGPRYQYNIDPNTGSMTRAETPVSGKHLAMAIALEAISGSLTGLANGKGAGNTGRGAAAAFAQGEQRVRDQDNRARAQASQEFARQASATQTNMRMAQSAANLGRLDFESHQDYVNSWKPLADYVAANNLYSDQHVREGDLLSKYHVAKDVAIPDGIVPRLDPTTGQQAMDAKTKQPLWDNTYTVLNPETPLILPTDTLKYLADHHVPGYYNMVDGKTVPVEMPKDFLHKAKWIIDGLSIASNMHVTEDTVNNQLKEYYQSKQPKQQGGKPQQTNTGTGAGQQQQNTGQPVSITDNAIGTLIDKYADKYGVPRNIARAMIRLESGGGTGNVNPKAQGPVTKNGERAQGLGQLMPATQKDYGVTDPFNPEQNIRASMHYLGHLIKQHGGSVEDGLRYYHGIGSDQTPGFKGTTDQEYAQKIQTLAGSGAPQQDQGQPQGPQAEASGQPQPDALVDVKKALESGQVSPQAMATFSKYVAAFPLDKAIEQMEKDKVDPQIVGQIASLIPYSVRQDMKLQRDANEKATLAKVKNDAEAALPDMAMSAEEALKETPVDHVRKNFLATLPGEDQSIVREIGEGRNTNISSYALGRSGQARRIRAEVSLAYPEYDFSRAEAYLKTRENFTSKKTQEGINALNTGMKHMLVMYKSANMLTTYPVVGAAARMAGYQPAIDLADAKAALVDEIGRAYKNGALTDADKKTWTERIQVMTPNEVKGNAVAFVKLLDGKMSSYVSDWKRGAPPGAPMPIEILDDDAAEAYREITGHDSKLAPSRVTGGEQQATSVAPENTIVDMGDGTQQIKKGGVWQKVQPTQPPQPPGVVSASEPKETRQTL